MARMKAHPIMPGNVYVSDLQLAYRFRVSRPTIWRWLKNGEIPKPYKFNGSTRWKLTDIEKFERKLEGKEMVKSIPRSPSHKQIMKAEEEKPDKKINYKQDDCFGVTIVHLEKDLYETENSMKESLRMKKDLEERLCRLNKSLETQMKKVDSFKKTINLLKIKAMT